MNTVNEVVLSQHLAGGSTRPLILVKKPSQPLESVAPEQVGSVLFYHSQPKTGKILK